MKTLAGAIKERKDLQSSIMQIILLALEDLSKWVRQTAKLTLGYVIGVVSPSLISESVLNVFASLPGASEETDDFEIAYACAFTFPSVVKNCGASAWPSLAACYNQLVKIPSDGILHTLGASLGEIATVLGTELTEEGLMPVVELFLASNTSEVVQAVMKSMGLLLPVITEESRQRLGDV